MTMMLKEKKNAHYVDIKIKNMAASWKVRSTPWDGHQNFRSHYLGKNKVNTRNWQWRTTEEITIELLQAIREHWHIKKTCRKQQKCDTEAICSASSRARYGAGVGKKIKLLTGNSRWEKQRILKTQNNYDKLCMGNKAQLAYSQNDNDNWMWI